MTEPVHLMTGIAPAAPIPAPTAAPEPIDVGDVITNMAAFREQAIEGLGAPGVRFQPGGPGTEVFTVPNMLLLTDAQNQEIAKPLNFVEIANVLLNTPDDDQVYARFAAAGGRAGDVMMAWRRMQSGLDIPK